MFNISLVILIISNEVVPLDQFLQSGISSVPLLSTKGQQVVCNSCVCSCHPSTSIVHSDLKNIKIKEY